MAEENPTLESTTEGTVQGAVDGVVDGEGAGQEEIDVDGLVAELEAAGVQTPKQLQGKLEASQNYGNVSEMLRQERDRANALEAQLRVTVQQQQNQGDVYDDDEGGVNLKETIRDVYREESARESQMRLQAQQVVSSQWREITSDIDYPQVKDIWEEQCKDPNFMAGIQNGQFDPVREYNQTVRRYFRGIAKKSVDAIRTLQKGGKTSLPHVEGSASLPDKISSNLSDKDEKINQYRERVAKTGKLTSENDALDVLDTLLG